MVFVENSSKRLGVMLFFLLGTFLIEVHVLTFYQLSHRGKLENCMAFIVNKRFLLCRFSKPKTNFSKGLKIAVRGRGFLGTRLLIQFRHWSEWYNILLQRKYVILILIESRKSVIRHNSKSTRRYSLPKIHKPNAPQRRLDSPTYNVAKYLVLSPKEIPKEILVILVSCLDSSHLFSLTSNDQLVSFGVTLLIH